jgi:hypothetical protein
MYVTKYGHGCKNYSAVAGFRYLYLRTISCVKSSIYCAVRHRDTTISCARMQKKLQKVVQSGRLCAQQVVLHLCNVHTGPFLGHECLGTRRQVVKVL